MDRPQGAAGKGTMRRLIRALASIAVGLAAVDGARGAEPAPPDDSQTLAPVEVTGFKDAARIRYERLLDGAATFARYQARAPAAALRFEVRDRAPEPRPALVVKLEIDDRLLGLDLDKEGRFVLPGRDVAGPGEGEVVSNRRSGQLRIYASVRSPGTTPHDRRLGDLRVECEVLWTIYRSEASFVVRNAVDLVGGICRSSVISVGMPSARKLSAATLVSGDRTDALKLTSTAMGYLAPLHDTSWPDDARVQLTDE